MSALSVDNSGDPRSQRYYAPRHRRVVAREATLQPVLERLRDGAGGYSADERLDGDAGPAALPPADFVVVPGRRFPIAALAAFAGGAATVAALAFAYGMFGTNGGPVAPQPAATAPAKIEARLAPNQPVSQRPAFGQLATANATAAAPVDAAKGDRLDASANPTVGATYNPLQSPLSLWSLSPTQAAIEGTDPALAARGAPPAAPVPETAAAVAAPPQQAAPEQTKPVEHRVVHAARHMRHVRHVRHHNHTTTGAAAGGANAAVANGAAAAQPAATKKFLGLFGG